MIKGRFKAKLGEELLKKRFQTRKRPQNCHNLVVPTVNKSIYKLSNAAQKADLSLAQTPRAIVKSAIAIASLSNDLLSAQSGTNEHTGSMCDQHTPMTHGERLKCCADAIAMLGFAF